MKRKAETTLEYDDGKVRKSEYALPNFAAAFRRRLKTENALFAIQEFIEANEERDVVDEYVNAGGSVKELIDLLKKFDGKNNFLVASKILSAINYVILRVVSDLLLHQDTTEAACKELLSMYQNTFQNMLSASSSSPSQRKVVLRFYTAIVTLSGNLAKMILTSFPFNSKLSRILTNLSSSSKSSKKLRICFIHFILSFLMDDNTALITELLQKKGLLTSIIPGLVNDESKTIVLVLNTLRLKIVENTKISKTLKLHAFNTTVLRMILKLYEIQENTSNEEREETDIENEPNFKMNSVRDAVHELLLLLCTSYKKGILFRQQNAVGKSPNQLILTLLEDISEPYKDELKSHLVSAILKVCPDFVKNVLSKLESDLHPRVSDDWIKLIDFVIQIIENQDVNSDNGGKDEAFVVTTTILFPPAVQKLFLRHIVDDSVHSHPAVRYNLVRLLHTILQKVSDLLEKLEECHKICSLKEQVAQFLYKVIIPTNKLLNAWKIGIKDITEENIDESDSNIDITELTEEKYYLDLADLLLLYNSLIPTCFNELRMTESINFDDYHNIIDSSEFRFKLAQLIFLIHNPKPIEPKFAFMMKHFVEYYVANDDFKLYDIIENVLRTTCFSEGFEDEVIIWLHSLKKCRSALSTVSDLFVSALRVSAQKSTQIFNQLTALSQDHPFSDNSNIDLNVVYEFGILWDMPESMLTATKPPVAISPVVFAFLDVLKSRKYKNDASKISVQNFTSILLVHLLHLQTTVKPLEALLDKMRNQYMDSRILDFISYWSNDTLIPKYPSYPLEFEKTAALFYSAFLDGNSLDEMVQHLIGSDESETILLWNLCVFYIVRLDQSKCLSDTHTHSVLIILEKLLEKISNRRAILCLESLLTNRQWVDSFTIEKKTRNSTLPNILLDIVLNSKLKLSKYSILVTPYRYKLITLLMNGKKNTNNLKISRKGFTIDRLIKFVALSGQTTIFLLQNLIPLPVSAYIDENHSRTSEWTEVIKCLLNVTADSLEIPLDSESLVLLMSKLNKVHKRDVNVEEIQDSIVKYFHAFPHHINCTTKDFIEDLCRSSNSSIYKLAAYLVPYHETLAIVLQEQILKSVEKMKLEPLLGMLNRIQKVGSIDEAILENLRKLYLCDIMKLFNDDDSPWLRNEYRIWTEKILSRLDGAYCLQMCKDIEASLSDLQLSENKCAVMKIIFEKSSKMTLYVQLLVKKYTELLSSNQDVLWLCDVISNIEGDLDEFTSILALPMWKEFVKLNLRIALQTDNAAMMRTFKIVCEKALNKDSTEEINLVFQMTISHSEFVNKMLNNSKMKAELIGLLLVLTQVNTSIMSSNHVPLLLSAYKATLAKSDQLLLQLLQWYEDNNIRFTDCRPYLWGEAAASHYSIQKEIRFSLKRQPPPNQVLELLDIKIIKNTIKYFPLQRPLWPGKCSHIINDSVYDLAFALPLLSHLLAPESRVSVQKFSRSGALCLILTALSCEDEALRNSAYHCLKRFEFHLLSREKEVQIWHQFISALKNGLMTYKTEKGPPRVPSLVTTFLANMSLIISEPLHILYSPVLNFLLAKPTFDLSTTPNFFMLFYSSDLKHRDHQKWMLKIIRDGMRYEKDWLVAQRSFLFKFILQFYSSSLSNESANATILQILGKAMEIEKCRLFLVTKCSLLSWINHVIRNMTSKYVHTFLPFIIKILKSLANTKNSKNLSSILVLLSRKLISVNVDKSVLEDLLEVLSNSYCLRKNNTLSEKDIKIILELAHPLLHSRLQKIFYNALKYKSILFLDEYCDSKVEKCIFRILQQFVQNN